MMASLHQPSLWNYKKKKPKNQKKTKKEKQTYRKIRTSTENLTLLALDETVKTDARLKFIW